MYGYKSIALFLLLFSFASIVYVSYTEIWSLKSIYYVNNSINAIYFVNDSINAIYSVNDSINAIYSVNDSIKSFNSTFVYSREILFDTLLDIRERNCRDKNLNSSFCKDIFQCNNANVYPTSGLSGCQKRLPGCLIIGVYKAGTRELIDFLMMHHGIVIRAGKHYEVRFFSSKWERGLEWYRNEMPYSMPDQITIEKSPAYFISEKSPSRIFAMNPAIKLILIVRNPVDRVISQVTFSYVNNKRRWKAYRNVSELLDYQILMKQNESNVVRNSKYDEPYHRYLQYFSRSQIHVIDSDQFKHDPYTVLRGVESFLSIKHVIKKEDFQFDEKKGFFCLRSLKLTSSVCYDDKRGRKNVVKNKERYREKLRQILQPHTERFLNVAGKNFSWN